ncbi:glycosyl transferase family 8 [Aquabacter cavernae]|uniref:glycosyl transferase family 8 n=1 Tax=Aquabacter cavernae TaxID=2496029 RepID=UPI000F8EDBFE|nr:glycosyl transferase family 8 [Aquabacter cavernae]
MNAPMPAARLDQAVVDLMGQGSFAQAEQMIRAHMSAHGATIPLAKLLARAVRGQGRIAEAAELQGRVVELMPGDLPGRFDLAESLLLMGEFKRGWREYHWRYDMPHTARIARKVQRPRWDGAPIPGKTLLIHDEQGFGDTLQFMRLVRDAKARSGARVVLEIHSALLPLARRMEGPDEIVERGQLPPAFDVHCEMMSLPMVLGLKLTDLPGPVPYLRADPARVARWRTRLAHLPRPIVALVWAGTPTHTNDANRSIPLERFVPLGAAGASFIAVQKGPRAAEALTPPAGLRMEALDSEIADFEDTAAILEVADLLISVDSSPIHLAGALGRPGWVLLPFVPDWRWLLERDDTPWYPSVRLFRQPKVGDWESVFAALARELHNLRY